MESNTTQPTMKYGFYHNELNQIYGFKAQCTLTSEVEAIALMNLFPKFVGFKMNKFYGEDKWLVDVRWISLSPDSVNKGINETGTRRIKSLLQTCRKHNIELTKDTVFANTAEVTIEQWLGRSPNRVHRSTTNIWPS